MRRWLEIQSRESVRRRPLLLARVKLWLNIANRGGEIHGSACRMMLVKVATTGLYLQNADLLDPTRSLYNSALIITSHRRHPSLLAWLAAVNLSVASGNWSQLAQV
jgi:hypothetical protein